MKLKEIRKQIDALDAQIIPLLTKRLKLVCELKEFKTSLTDAEREAEILAKIEDESIREVYISLFRIFKNHIAPHL